MTRVKSHAIRISASGRSSREYDEGHALRLSIVFRSGKVGGMHFTAAARNRMEL